MFSRTQISQKAFPSPDSDTHLCKHKKGDGAQTEQAETQTHTHTPHKGKPGYSGSCLVSA